MILELEGTSAKKSAQVREDLLNHDVLLAVRELLAGAGGFDVV